MSISILNLHAITRLSPFGDNVKEGEGTNSQYFEHVNNLSYGSFLARYFKDSNEVGHLERIAFSYIGLLGMFSTTQLSKFLKTYPNWLIARLKAQNSP